MSQTTAHSSPAPQNPFVSEQDVSLLQPHDASSAPYTYRQHPKPPNLPGEYLHQSPTAEELILQANQHFEPEALYYPVGAESMDYQPIIYPPQRSYTSAFGFSAPPLPPEPENSYDDLLNRLDQHQDALRTARDEVLGARYRLATQRRELKEIRGETASQAGNTMDLMIRFFLREGIDVPHDIKSAIDRNNLLRESLGNADLEYEEAEAAYDLKEWEYTEEEKRVFDDLFEGPSNSPVPSLSGFGTMESPPWKAHDPETPSTWAAPDLFEMPIPPSSELEVSDPDPIATLVGGVEAHIADKFGAPFQQSSASSWAGLAPKQVLEHETPPPSRLSGAHLDHTRVKWTYTRERIDDWIWEALESSKVQQVQLWNEVSPDPGLDDKEWWSLIKSNWTSNSQDHVYVHTGDTTTSSGTLSVSVSAATMRKLFEDTSSITSEMRPFSATPLISDDRIVDALEKVNFPADLEADDLVDHTTKHVTFDDRSHSAQSLLTEPTVYTRSSSGISSDLSSRREASSMSSFDGTNSWQSTKSAKGNPIQGSETIQRLHLEQQIYVEEQLVGSDHSTPHILPSIVVTPHEVDVPPAIPHISMPEGAYEQQTTTAEAYASSSDPASSQQLGSLRDLFIEPLTELPYALPTTDQTPFGTDAYIRVENGQPWYMPLLRLTPFYPPSSPGHAPMHGSRHLYCIPFVSTSDSPFHVPGPVQAI